MGNSCGNCASNNVEALNEFVFGKDFPEKKSRANAGKTRFCDAISHATKIQSAWRGYCVRKQCMSRRPKEYFAKEDNEVGLCSLHCKCRSWICQ